MTATVIGIFDRDHDLDEALAKLDEKGFDQNAFEIIDRMQDNDATAPAAGPAVLPGMAPAGVDSGVKARESGAIPGPSRVNEIEERLSDLGLTAEEMEFYFHGISGDSRLLVGRVPAQRAAEAAHAMREANAERVSLHSSR